MGWGQCGLGALHGLHAGKHRRLEAGDSPLAQEFCHGFQRSLQVLLAGVVTAAAVDVHVDEAGAEPGSPCIDDFQPLLPCLVCGLLGVWENLLDFPVNNKDSPVLDEKGLAFGKDFCVDDGIVCFVVGHEGSISYIPWNGKVRG